MTEKEEKELERYDLYDRDDIRDLVCEIVRAGKEAEGLEALRKVLEAA